MFRKNKLFRYVLLLLVLLITTALPASAETLPVKKAEILGENCIIVLRENGDLLWGTSIDTQSPQILAQNVIEYKHERNVNGTLRNLIALHSDGDITTISINKAKEKIVATERLKVNAEKIYFIGDSAGYLTKNHELKFKCNTGVFNCDICIDNIKKVCASKKSWGPIYAISLDNTLYCYEVNNNEEVEKTEILTDVNDCILANSNDILVLRNNCDLYFIEQDKTPERIGTNIESMEKVAFESTWTNGYTIDYLNKNGEYYSGSTQKAYTKYLDNVREVKIINSYKYVITNDNIIYICSSQYEGLVNPRKVENAKDVTGFSDNGYETFYVAENGSLYDRKSNFYMTDIADVIWYDALGTDKDRYLYLKQNGELWGAFNDSPSSMFITAFCQKPTIVEINKEEITLEAKIQVVNNRSMYPFRECLESMGATVLWDSVNKIAIGEYNGNTIEFPIGSNKYYVNGVSYEMDTKSYIDNSLGRTYIPIRYAAEGLGFKVDWIEGDSENIIKIYK